MTFTPMLTNDRLASIGFTPEELSATKLKEALKDPVNSSEMLIRIFRMVAIRRSDK